MNPQICNTARGLCPECQTLHNELSRSRKIPTADLIRHPNNYPVIFWRDLPGEPDPQLADHVSITMAERLLSIYDGIPVPVHWAMTPFVDRPAVRVRFMVDFPALVWDLDEAWMRVLFSKHGVDAIPVQGWFISDPLEKRDVNLSRLKFFAEKVNPSRLTSKDLTI
ncbi:uncharacterized protein BJX67DRAFT_378369 [Aspergillus lucknowensis]|uniref:Uncharacterized protein n=1 Tax=Aspergillus lucknowensis TaxID=176173 RepID=A0ABR4M0Q2_9EURO